MFTISVFSPTNTMYCTLFCQCYSHYDNVFSITSMFPLCQRLFPSAVFSLQHLFLTLPCQSLFPLNQSLLPQPHLFIPRHFSVPSYYLRFTQSIFSFLYCIAYVYSQPSQRIFSPPQSLSPQSQPLLPQSQSLFPPLQVSFFNGKKFYSHVAIYFPPTHTFSPINSLLRSGYYRLKRFLE